MKLIVFNQVENYWEASFKAGTDLMLRVDRSEPGRLNIFKTAMDGQLVPFIAGEYTDIVEFPVYGVAPETTITVRSYTQPLEGGYLEFTPPVGNSMVPSLTFEEADGYWEASFTAESDFALNIDRDVASQLVLMRTISGKNPVAFIAGNYSTDVLVQVDKVFPGTLIVVRSYSEVKSCTVSEYTPTEETDGSVDAHNVSLTAHADIRALISQLDAANTAEHADIREAVSELEAAVENLTVGSGSHAKVFDTLEALEAWLAIAENKATLQVGDNLYIRATDTPDYWWDGERKQELEGAKVELDTSNLLKYVPGRQSHETQIELKNYSRIIGTIKDDYGMMGIPGTDDIKSDLIRFECGGSSGGLAKKSGNIKGMRIVLVEGLTKAPTEAEREASFVAVDSTGGSIYRLEIAFEDFGMGDVYPLKYSIYHKGKYEEGYLWDGYSWLPGKIIQIPPNIDVFIQTNSMLEGSSWALWLIDYPGFNIVGDKNMLLDLCSSERPVVQLYDSKEYLAYLSDIDAKVPQALLDSFAFTSTAQTVASLTNIPVSGGANVTANLTADQSLSISGALLVGYAMMVRACNTGSSTITVTLPTNSEYLNDSGKDSFTIEAGKSAEISIRCYQSGEYSIRVAE